jgi:hypothetical protein
MEERQQATRSFVQAGLDVQTWVVCIAVLWFGRTETKLGFCLLTCTLISLISSGSGRTSNKFQPCSKPSSLVASHKTIQLLFTGG